MNKGKRSLTQGAGEGGREGPTRTLREGRAPPDGCIARMTNDNLWIPPSSQPPPPPPPYVPVRLSAAVMTSPTKPGFLGITTVTKNAAEKTMAAPIISRRTDSQRLMTWRGGG